MTVHDLQFSNFPDAFDFCRECDWPVIVIIAGWRWKLFPSGRAERVYHTLACGCKLPVCVDTRKYMDRLIEHVRQCEKAQQLLIDKRGKSEPEVADD